MKTLTIFISTLMIMLGGITLSSSVMAQPGQDYGSHHADHHGGMGMSHGMGMGRGYSSWKASLSDEQRAKIDKLHLAKMKKKLKLKNKKQQAKLELAMLVTGDSPSKNSINKKIDEIVELKRQMMRVKYDYKVKVRKVLTAEQRVGFDTHVLKKATRGKRRCH